MKKLVIDCDPGHDDIIAILIALAHKKEFEILGFSTVAGNQTIEKVSDNLLKVLDYIGYKLPVSVGASKPLSRDSEPQPQAHGESGMDGPVLKRANSTPTQMSAVEFLKKSLEENDKITIVGIGPLTNIAQLLSKYPHLKDKIEEIVIMGGSVYSGNILPKSEFNIYHDPEAAKIVFNAKVPLTMCGLEVCKKGGLPLEEIDDFKGKGKVSQLVYELLCFYSRYSYNHHIPYTTIFDMTTIIYLLKPEIFKEEIMNVDIELEGEYTRGMTVCEKINDDSYIHNPIKVLMDVESESFIKVFKDSISILDKETR